MEFNLWVDAPSRARLIYPTSWSHPRTLQALCSRFTPILSPKPLSRSTTLTA